MEKLSKLDIKLRDKILGDLANDRPPPKTATVKIKDQIMTPQDNADKNSIIAIMEAEKQLRELREKKLRELQAELSKPQESRKKSPLFSNSSPAQEIIQTTTSNATKELQKDIQKAPELQTKNSTNNKITTGEIGRIGEFRRVDLSELRDVMPKMSSGISMSTMLFGNIRRNIALPYEIHTNPAQNLFDAWKKKIAIYGKANPGLAPFFHDIVKPELEKRGNFRGISRKIWNQQVGQSIDIVKNKLKIDAFFPKDPKKNALIKNLISHVGVEEMNSIFFAELIDSKDPKRAEAFFNTIIENFGPNFLYLFPAMGDKYLSFGPAQLTKFAVGENGGIDFIQSKYMTGQALMPRNIKHVSEEEHLIGGYIFSIYNIYTMLLLANPSQISKLNIALTNDKKNTINKLTQYIAASHNSPAESNRQFRKWLDAGLVGAHFSDWLTRPTADNNAIKARVNQLVQKEKYNNKLAFLP